MNVSSKTHVGHVRQVNEDSCATISREPYTLLAIVADGMGGHQAGDVASQMALQHVTDAFQAVEMYTNAEAWELWLKQTIQEANQAIFQYAGSNESLRGMGTTIVAGVFNRDYYVIAHVGDSRIYRYAKQSLEAITEDHSLVYELLRKGQISREEADKHPQRNVITRALGTEQEVEVDVKILSYIGDEQILLCSDGLSDMMNEQQMAEILSSNASVDQKSALLVERALQGGGEDNITLILIETLGEQSDDE